LGLPWLNETLPLPHSTSAAFIDASFEGCNFSSNDVSAGSMGLDKLARSRSTIPLLSRFAMGLWSFLLRVRHFDVEEMPIDPIRPNRLVS